MINPDYRPRRHGTMRTVRALLKQAEAMLIRARDEIPMHMDAYSSCKGAAEKVEDAIAYLKHIDYELEGCDEQTRERVG